MRVNTGAGIAAENLRYMPITSNARKLQKICGESASGAAQRSSAKNRQA